MAKSTTTSTKRAGVAGGDAKQQQKRKRRRRNARTGNVSSSSESSDSSSSEDEKEGEEEKGQEVVMKDVSDLEDDSEEEEAELEATSAAQAFTEKSSSIPSTLRDLHDPLAAARFEEYYMQQLTGEFGDDLNAVRLSKDFGANSLPMLVRALKQGINIFDAAEKRVVVGSTTS